MHLKTIPLEAIELDRRNPRTDAESAGLEELAASLRSDGVVQPPVVVPEGERFRLLRGERRVRAARLAGLTELPCLVREAPGPLQAHRLRVAENLHRRELNPLDHAAALRLAWLSANAEEMGLAEQAAAVLARPLPPVEALPEMERLLEEHGFRPSAPAVTWEALLDGLGLEMRPARRKKLLRILSIPQDVQKTLRETPVTEAAIRSIGTLEEDAQRQVAEAIAGNPALAPKARRIARAVREQGYSVEEALAEARGEFLESEPEGDAADALKGQSRPDFESDRAITDAVLLFIDAANGFLSALAAVRGAAPEPADIPEPWKNFYLNALDTVRDEL